MHQFPLPGIAVFIVSVGCAWLVFAGILALVCRKYPDNPFTDAFNDLFSSGSVEAA